jgi:hypothetical protein
MFNNKMDLKISEIINKFMYIRMSIMLCIDE